MRMALGSEQHDLSTRALVLGAVPMTAAGPSTAPPGPADDLLAAAGQLVDAGADLLIVPSCDDAEVAAQAIRRLRDRFDLPIAVRLSSADRGQDAAASFVRAGAAMLVGLRPEADADCIATITDSKAFVVLRAEPGRTDDAEGPLESALGAAAAAVRAVEAAGVARQRIGLEVTGALDLAPPAAAALGPADRLVALRCPVLVSLAPWDDDPVEAVTAASLAVLSGRRLICTRQVKAVRRACDVVSAVLEAER